MKQYNSKDDHIDELLIKYASLTDPKSFFLNAGAGAGKTRSLVNLLNNILLENGEYFKITNKKIAVITYTKVASEEIISRVKENSIFEISTIHSYAWKAIQGFNGNIKEILMKFLKLEIESVNQGKARDKQEKLQLLNNKLNEINTKTSFKYSPESTIGEKGSLTHSEVLKIFAYLLNTNSLFRNLISTKYPIILIDESQDTNKNILDSFLILNETNNICLGLFGDLMQRVYLDGKADLITALKGLEKPEKKVNWRSYGRIVKFTNNLRKNIDSLQQEVSHEERETQGLLKIYLADNKNDRIQVETEISEIVEKEVIKTGLDKIYSPYTLVLEHRLAAERNGFLELYDALKSSNDTNSSLIEGESKEHSFFKYIVIPIFHAWKENDDLKLHLILKEHSHRFDELENLNIDSYEVLKNLGTDYKEFLDSFKKNLTIGEVLEALVKANLFDLPKKFIKDYEGDTGWKAALEVNFNELVNFYNYTNGLANIVTQQGSKGLEYDHVKVIIDDYNAKGKLFSYEKLFGVKEKTKTDISNENEGKDTSLNKTNRLFYVACSRTIKSLILVVYTENPDKVKDFFINNSFASKDEIKVI